MKQLEGYDVVRTSVRSLREGAKGRRGKDELEVDTSAVNGRR